MNLTEVMGPARKVAFRAWRALTTVLPGGRFGTFGPGVAQIGAIVVINLDRQPERWSRVSNELRRFRTSDGAQLTSIARRHAAVDARDGRSVAATADVDPTYRIGNQLYVQPDTRLEASFAADEPVRMTPQEVAVARSHIEVWKTIAIGTNHFVLVLEDDAWFKPGARSSIDRAWCAAFDLFASGGGPCLLYLSYEDAGGTAVRADANEDLFRPMRGLWFLSGYVLSREGAAKLLRAMPVVGPVDLWMNYRFAELDALAIASPAIAQRPDVASDNAYSVMPYLARAGVVDGRHGTRTPNTAEAAPILAWTGPSERESLAMALSMLGRRVRAFDGNEGPIDELGLSELIRTFDALVDPPLEPAALTSAMASERTVFLLESSAPTPVGLEGHELPPLRSAILDDHDHPDGAWESICSLLAVARPVEAFPGGAPREFRMFRDGRSLPILTPGAQARDGGMPMDDSPWVLPAACRWKPSQTGSQSSTAATVPIFVESMTEASLSFPALSETFPGNLASFAPENLVYGDDGVRVSIDVEVGGLRPFRSGAFASKRSFTHGRFQAEIRPAAGSGLVTGFFLHRSSPRQEIDIEFAGRDPQRMLVNVFFNPGDEGSAMAFGYRGSPCWVDLGFDSTEDFHEYAIEWRPESLTWFVDGAVVHERASWDPTPIPHLGMQVHANLWAPRSQELAGRVSDRTLPAVAEFRNVLVTD